MALPVYVSLQQLVKALDADIGTMRLSGLPMPTAAHAAGAGGFDAGLGVFEVDAPTARDRRIGPITPNSQGSLSYDRLRSGVDPPTKAVSMSMSQLPTGER